MKPYIIILFILGLGALTSYWGITSDRMARSFTESQSSGKLALVAEASATRLIVSDSVNVQTVSSVWRKIDMDSVGTNTEIW